MSDRFLKVERWHAPQDYQTMMNAMETHMQAMGKEEAPEALWFLEHTPVYSHGPLKPDIVPSIAYVSSSRGGKMTHHGPGQRLVYLMLDLKKRAMPFSIFFQKIQDWLADVFVELSIPLVYTPENPGFWHAEGKVVAIGLAVRGGKTFHGFSINVCNDLVPFSKIDPCGLKGGKTTSLVHLGYPLSLALLDDVLLKHCPFFWDKKPVTLQEHKGL